MPNETNATKDEIQLIFKLRSRMTETKVNYKGLYDTYECDLCGEEDESQEHILYCQEIIKRNPNFLEKDEYEKIFNGNPSEKLKLARIFQQNMNIKETIMKEKCAK